MADINSSLPIRTQAAGDVSVKTDQTTHGTTDLVAADITKVNGNTALAGNGVTGTGSPRVTIASDNTPFPVKTDQTSHGTTDLVAADVTKINGTALLAGNGVTGTGSPRVTIASDNTPFPVKTDQTSHGTTDLVAADLTKIAGTATATGNGVVGAGVQRVAIASDNTPVPVSFGNAVTTGKVNSYGTSSAVAAAGTSNHDYTVTAGKTLLLKSVSGSASGKMKVEIIYDPAGTPATQAVFFLSTANPTFQFNFPQPFEAAATKVVRVARTNLESSAMDVYSVINGVEV